MSGWARDIRGARVELMAATAPNGISNSRMDRPSPNIGVKAFIKLLKVGTPFACEDLCDDINSDWELSDCHG
jgi:hypothetical protein